jgi:type III pantothenate kinase
MQIKHDSEWLAMETVYNTSIELNGLEYGIAGIDVGNSRVKIHHEETVLSIPYDKDWKKHVQHHFRDHVSRRYLIGLSSVNPKQTTSIVKVIQRTLGHMVLNAHQLLMRNERLLSLSSIENAGIDRMLGTIGAMARYGAPIITVDCGTAVTINAVSKDQEFLGGLIFAGLGTQLYGLSKQTAAIPDFKFSPIDAVIGVNTEQCLMAGVYASVTGGIQQAVTSISKGVLKNQDVPVVVSGGEGSWVTAGISTPKKPYVYCPTIVTDGILQLLANAKLVDIQDAIIGKLPR